MKLIVGKDGVIQLEEVFCGVLLKTRDGEVMSICMRDTGFEFSYQGKQYFAKEGYLEKFKTSVRGNPLVDQRHSEEGICVTTDPDG